MKRIILVVTVALIMAAALALAGPASADAGGQPNQNGCFGQAFQDFNQTQEPSAAGESISGTAQENPELVSGSRRPNKFGCV